MHVGLYVQCPPFLPGCNETCILSTTCAAIISSPIIALFLLDFFTVIIYIHFYFTFVNVQIFIPIWLWGTNLLLVLEHPAQNFFAINLFKPPGIQANSSDHSSIYSGRSLHV